MGTGDAPERTEGREGRTAAAAGFRGATGVSGWPARNMSPRQAGERPRLYGRATQVG
ncbi:hypothetical protein HEP81_03303 [Streptomyces griseofuscus]|uniref:Uncharacterized protein n=1 Tax=Streptomyces griseofuscus TaxID=146922 RepID=A0A7H1PZY0_9ACTN|nr:hypothetical protein [Streptomyces murinus]QNT93610.1 hypothetical protein HEP81_03303 [Streptomyces griseofuscus]